MQHIEIPSGSKIKKEISPRGDVTLYWHKPDGGIMRYLIGLFMLAWMGGWFFGFKDVLSKLIDNPNAPNSGFLMFWLAGWSIGGCAVVWYLFLIFRIQKPEKISLYSDRYEYDTGTTSPIAAMFNRNHTFNPAVQWSKILQKRKVFPALRKGEIQFVHEKNPSRLYFDRESKRYEIGTSLSEPEIDWLANTLKDFRAG